METSALKATQRAALAVRNTINSVAANAGIGPTATSIGSLRAAKQRFDDALATFNACWQASNDSAALMTMDRGTDEWVHREPLAAPSTPIMLDAGPNAETQAAMDRMKQAASGATTSAPPAGQYI